METKRKFIHILLRESEKDGTKTEMKIMYSIFEKIIFGAVALGVTLLILFMNSTKDIQLGSALSETAPVVSQEVATVSDEVVEPEVGSTVDGTTEDSITTEAVLENEMYVQTTDVDALKETKNYFTFKEAFAEARSDLGPGEVFEWNGSLYTTNYFYETKIVIGNEVVLDQKNATIVDTETIADISEITSYTTDEKTDISFDFYTGKTTGTSNDIASTTIQNQRVIDEE